jgi:hypothetical protein
MITPNITDKGKKLLMEAISEKSKENPFIKDDGKLYFRFNKIKIENKSGFWGSSDGVVVNYCWDDLELFAQETSGIRFDKGSTLTLNGIEGRIEVIINFQ